MPIHTDDNPEAPSAGRRLLMAVVIGALVLLGLVAFGAFVLLFL